MASVETRKPKRRPRRQKSDDRDRARRKKARLREKKSRAREKARRARKRRGGAGGKGKTFSRREKAERRKELRQKAFLWGRVTLVSGAINAGIVAILMLVILSVPAKPPPVIITTNPNPEQLRELRNREIERMRTQQRASSASAAPMPTVIAPALSPIAFDPPDFEVTDIGNLSGMIDDFGSGSGMGGLGLGGGDGGSLGGMNIKAQRLGVVLDVSGSMNEEIRAVREEIRRSFSRAVIVEVVGCRLDFPGDDPSFDPTDTQSAPPLEKYSDSVTGAIQMLISRARVDAIFWFSDLNDAQTKAGRERLAHLLGIHIGSERRPVRFYVQSVDREPSDDLATIARRSGGESKVQKYAEEE